MGSSSSGVRASGDGDGRGPEALEGWSSKPGDLMPGTRVLALPGIAVSDVARDLVLSIATRGGTVVLFADMPDTTSLAYEPQPRLRTPLAWSTVTSQGEGLHDGFVVHFYLFLLLRNASARAHKHRGGWIWGPRICSGHTWSRRPRGRRPTLPRGFLCLKIRPSKIS